MSDQLGKKWEERGTRLERSFEDRPVRTGLKAVTLVIALGASISIIGGVGYLVSLPFRSATGVIQRTLEPDNVITKYEWYRDASQQLISRVAQISEHKSMIEGETDAAEIRRLKIELSAIRQSCRDLANKYNANSLKINVAIFRGTNVPATEDVSQCE